MPDEIVTDPEAYEEPHVDRVPTKPLIEPRPAAPTQPMAPRHKGRIEVDLDAPEAVAEFLEMVASIVREKRRLVLIIE